MNINSYTSAYQTTFATAKSKDSSNEYFLKGDEKIGNFKSFASELVSITDSSGYKTMTEAQINDYFNSSDREVSQEERLLFAQTSLFKPEMIDKVMQERTEERLQKRDIKDIFTIDGLDITIFQDGSVQTPNRFGHLVGSSEDKTISNILETFGNKVKRQSFAPGESPTRAEYIESLRVRYAALRYQQK